MKYEFGRATVDGASLYYERAGQGEPVVLLHTGNGNAMIWDGQFEELARDYSVIRYDLRGFGRSAYPARPYLPARDLAGLLTHVGVDSAHIIAPSLGGRIAVDFSVLYPAMVRSLLLAAPVAVDHAWSEDVISVRMAEEEAFVAGEFARATELMMKVWVAGPNRKLTDLAPELIERIRITQRMAYGTRMSALNEAGSEPDEEPIDPPIGDRLSEITVPTLVLIGGQDLPDAIAIGDRLSTEIKNVRRLVFEDSGHMITMERPDRFVDTARDFLREVTAS